MKEKIALTVVVESRTENKDGTVRVDVNVVDAKGDKVWFNYGVFTSAAFPGVKDLVAGDRLTLTIERAEPADISAVEATIEEAERGHRLELA